MNALRVFILGPARSGTSAILLALHDVFDLPAEGESHIVPAFQRVIHGFAVYCEQFDAADGILARKLDRRDFREYVVRYMRDFYARTFPSGAFADKTPGAEAIAGAPLIRQTFPDARIILTRRNGIEAVQSHVRRFGADFADACRGWAACMQAVEQVRPTVTDLLELDHHELAAQPEEAAIRLCRYLDQPTRAEQLARYFQADRHDSAWDHDWHRMRRLDEMEWTAEQRQTFQQICGPHMQRFGYPI